MLAAPVQQDMRVVENSGLLVITDDQTIRSLLQNWFQQKYKLIFAESGADVAVTLRQQPVELVLLDVEILEARGFDVLHSLRSLQLHLPVIVMSPLGENETLVQALQLGANDYVTKPLEAEAVRARLNTQLALKQHSDDTKPTLSQLKFTQEMQENFTRIVSHDLKGPLTNIRMAQFMLRDIVRDNSEAKNILDTMDMTLNSMIEMIRVFLDAMDSQKLEPVIVPLEVHDLVVQTIEQYRLAAEHKQMELSMHDCNRYVKADERLLRQALGNLVSNAIKFSPSGSKTAIWTEAHGEMIRICVEDHGPGIPSAERNGLFNMFSKLSPRPTDGEASTGLGLWIVRQLTLLQRGRVGYDQPTEGGSLFWIELPAADVPAAAEAGA